MMLRIVLMAFALVIPLTAHADDPEPTSRFTATLRKDDDKFEGRARGAIAEWKISSRSGIGGATIDLSSGSAPRKIVLRFAGMQRLEFLQLTLDGVRVASRLDSVRARTVHFDQKGAVVADTRKAAGSLAIEQDREGIRVTLVQTKPGKKWAIEWIDAFRR